MESKHLPWALLLLAALTSAACAGASGGSTVTIRGSLTRFDGPSRQLSASCDATPDLETTPLVITDPEGEELGAATFQRVDFLDPSTGMFHGCRRDADYTATVPQADGYVFRLGQESVAPAAVTDADLGAHGYVWSMNWELGDTTSLSDGDGAYGCFDKNSQNCQNCEISEIEGPIQIGPKNPPDYCPGA